MSAACSRLIAQPTPKSPPFVNGLLLTTQVVCETYSNHLCMVFHLLLGG